MKVKIPVKMHYLFAEIKANSILQISKLLLFAELKSASCNPDMHTFIPKFQ